MIRTPKFNSSRERLKRFNEDFAKKIPQDSFVLDAGAGSMPYRNLFDHTNYESADFRQVRPNEPNKITYVCDLQNIPVGNSRFDFIIFNQVMEHLPEPALVLKELNRILKDTGKILYTAPLFYEEHMAPHDYYRYTQYGINHLFSQANFSIDKLDWLEGYFGTVAYQFDTMSRYLPSTPRQIGTGINAISLATFFFFLKLILALLSRFFHKLEMKKKYTKMGYPKNYVVIASKKSDI